MEADLRRAGARMKLRDGATEALDFGSATSELANCRRAVGLALRVDLGVLDVQGPPGVIDDVSARHTDLRLAQGEVAAVQSSFWARVGPHELLVLCPSAAALRLGRRLSDESRRFAGLHATERSRELVALEVLGRRTRPLLSKLGAESADRGAGLAHGTLAGAEVVWVVVSEELAVAVVPTSSATTAWREIARVGRSYGLGYVGMDAVRRFALASRLEQARQPAISTGPVL